MTREDHRHPRTNFQAGLFYRQRREFKRGAMRLWKDLDEMIFSKPSFSLCVPPWLGRKSAPKLIAGGVLTCVLVYRVKTTSDKTKHHEKKQEKNIKKQQKKTA